MEISELLRVLVLSLVQGVTEFLPISSSAHLILVPTWLGWEDRGLAHDVVAHFGTLCAVLIYYRRDLARMIYANQGGAVSGEASADGVTLSKLAVASAPVLLCGYLFAPYIETAARSAELIAYVSLIFSAFLLAAHYRRPRERAITWSSAILIGGAQAVALVPGVSRMGVTLAAALLLGVARPEALRFVLLLSIPVILAANGYTLSQLSFATETDASVWISLALGFVVSGIVALITIHLFAGALERIGLLPFVVYRVLLSATILLFAT